MTGLFLCLLVLYLGNKILFVKLIAEKLKLGVVDKLLRLALAILRCKKLIMQLYEQGIKFESICPIMR